VPLAGSIHHLSRGEPGLLLAFRSAAILSTKPAEPSIFNVCRGWGISMPLTRGRILGYDSERMAFGFTMLNDSEAVECQISAAAMDDLAGGRGTALAEREAQFLHLRETIESIASAKFDTGTVVTGGVVRIFAKDIRK
jgi:Protein of unknown function (DUF1488)